MTILAHFGSKMAKKKDLHQVFKRSKEVVCRGHDLHQMPAKWRRLTATLKAKKVALHPTVAFLHVLPCQQAGLYHHGK